MKEFFLFCASITLLFATGTHLNRIEPLTQTAPAENCGVFSGINAFSRDSSITPLNCSVHDAVEMAWLFVVELKQIPPENCVLLISNEPAADAESITQHYQELKRLNVKIELPTRNNILAYHSAMQKYKGNPASLAVSFSSTHGYHVQDTAWIMPSDAINERASETCVCVNELERLIGSSRAGFQLVMLDACRRETGTGYVSSVQNSSRTVNRPASLARLSSCSPGEVSYQAPVLGPHGHSVFTWHFLRGVRSAVPIDDQGFVRLGAVMDYCTRKATKWTDKQCDETQHPATDSPELILSWPLCRRGYSEKTPSKPAATAPTLHTSLIPTVPASLPGRPLVQPVSQPASQPLAPTAR
jgi:hypothetical protein